MIRQSMRASRDISRQGWIIWASGTGALMSQMHTLLPWVMYHHFSLCGGSADTTEFIQVLDPTIKLTYVKKKWKSGDYKIGLKKLESAVCLFYLHEVYVGR